MDNNKKETSYRFKNPRKITYIAMTTFYIYLAITVILILSSIYQHSLLLDLRDGAPLTEEAVIANDDRQSMFTGWWVISLLITATFYFIWLYRVVSNSRIFHPKNIKFTPGRSIAWYFLPIVSLFWPYKDMQKLWKVNDEPHNWNDKASSSLIKWWWFFWLFSNVIIPVGVSGLEKANNIDSALFFSLVSIVGYASQAFCAFLLLLILKAIYKKQTDMYRIYELMPQ